MSGTARPAHPDAASGSLAGGDGAQAAAIWITQGNFYVSSRPGLCLSTVLGSCIAVCMRDRSTGCGGMNHFLLPDAEIKDDHFPTLALRYGSYSVERLINAILSRGGRRDRLEVKVFGGASVVAGMSDVGARNVDFIGHYFARERLPVAAADTRGRLPRKLRYFPATGRALVCELRERDAVDAVRQETAMRAAISFAGVTGGVEVF